MCNVIYNSNHPVLNWLGIFFLAERYDIECSASFHTIWSSRCKKIWHWLGWAITRKENSIPHLFPPLQLAPFSLPYHWKVHVHIYLTSRLMFMYQMPKISSRHNPLAGKPWTRLVVSTFSMRTGDMSDIISDSGVHVSPIMLLSNFTLLHLWFVSVSIFLLVQETRMAKTVNWSMTPNVAWGMVCLNGNAVSSKRCLVEHLSWCATWGPVHRRCVSTSRTLKISKCGMLMKQMISMHMNRTSKPLLEHLRLPRLVSYTLYILLSKFRDGESNFMGPCRMFPSQHFNS